MLFPAPIRQSGADYWLGRLASGWDLLNESGELTAHIEGSLDQPPALCADGRFRGLRDKEWVLFDRTGRRLLPPEGRLAHANCDARLLVNVGERVGIVDAAMRWIVPPKFEELKIVGAAEGRPFAKIDGKFGVMGPDGSWILDPVYDDLKIFVGGTFAASRQGKYGVWRSDGVWLIEPKFEDVNRLS